VASGLNPHCVQNLVSLGSPHWGQLPSTAEGGLGSEGGGGFPALCLEAGGGGGGIVAFATGGLGPEGGLGISELSVLLERAGPELFLVGAGGRAAFGGGGRVFFN